jgi:uroporphyrinogen-III synthase
MKAMLTDTFTGSSVLLDTWLAPDDICAMNRHILLLRTPSTLDAYHNELSALGYDPHSIPPLETTLVHLDDLRARLSRAPAGKGVILTSARGAEAWRATVIALLDAKAEVNSYLHAWHALRFYVVGAATASALTAHDPAHPNLPVPTDIRGAAETGTGARLAQFIINDLGGEQAVLLCLTGDKNSDELPETLKKAEIGLDMVQVYETRGSTTFRDDLCSLMEEVRRKGLFHSDSTIRRKLSNSQS